MHTPFQQVFAVFCLSLSLLAGNGAVAESALNIKPVADELYQFNNSAGDSGVVLITSQGAIVGDPLDEATSRSLAAHLATEFESPVRYVFYTRADASRAAGARVFADAGALVVAHSNALQSAAVIDGKVSSPDLVFTDSMSIRLGNQSVTLEHPGNSMNDHLLVARFTWQKVLFAAGIVAVESLPTLALDSGYYPDWFLSIDRISRLDFSYVLDGQGNIGNRNDAKQFEYYLRELHNRVSSASAEGETEEQMLDEIKMARYRNWKHYDDALSANVLSMYRAVQQAR